MALYLSSCEIVQEIEFHNSIKDKATLDAYLLSKGNAYKSIKQAIGIIHDKDILENGENKKIHFHIYLKFGTSQSVEWISSVFEVAPQYVNKIKGKWRDALAYATHLNSPNKYKYDNNELTLYNIDIQEYEKEISQVDLDKKIIENALYDYGNLKMTKRKLLNEFLNDASIYARYTKLYNKMTDYRLLKVSERQMEVFYITGASGTGKTTLAKFLSGNFNFDYFVCGSGSDPLDGYDKEECIIFDDLRNDTFTSAELFKLTDNHTNSSVKSRYKNKDISNCKLLIITSIKDPRELYNWQFEQEPFTQFARRINYSYLRIIDNKILGMKLDKKDPLMGKTTYDICPYDMEQVFLAMNIIRDSEKLFDSIFSIDFEKFGGADNEKK